MPPTVAVVGGGAAGLMAAKNFLEDGFDVTLFEARDYIGGLWKDSPDASLSVHEGTIFNSSIFRSRISDFPFPEGTDEYPTAAQLYDYLVSYAAHFNLGPHIRVSTRVTSITREHGQWLVATTSTSSDKKDAGQKQTSQYFDKVCTATGFYLKPKMPVLEGLAAFKGRVCHSIEYHDPEPYRDQTVLLIGMHATAQDVTNSLSQAASKVYLAHRSGLLFVRRFADDGRPFDSTLSLNFTFMQMWLQTNFPRLFFWLVDRGLASSMKKLFPGVKPSWALTPAPSLAVSTPLMADTLWPFLTSGFAEPVPAVRRITGPSTVELTNGRVLEGIDSIIFCTGYETNIPDNIIPPAAANEEGYHPYPNGAGVPPRLYRNIFSMHPDESVRNSLAFMGQGGIPLPGLIGIEAMCMSISQVWRGRAKLPPRNEMLKWHAQNVKRMDYLKKTYQPKPNSTFYPFFLDFAEHFQWMDKTAGFGFYATFSSASWFSWRAWRFWLRDRAFYNLCLNGLYTPALWRLFDMGGRKPLPWDECKKDIEAENKRLEASQKKKKAEMDAAQALLDEKKAA